MASNSKSQPPPPYAEPEWLSQPSATSRDRNLTSIITDEIIPVVNYRRKRGHNDTTVALLLMTHDSEGDASAVQSSRPNSADVLEPASDDELHAHILLTDFMACAEWWIESGAVADLARTVRRVWCSRTRPPDSKETPAVLPDKSSRSYLVQNGLMQPELPPRYTRSPPTRIHHDSEDQIQVEAKLDEICFRTISDFGVYDTITRSVVLVQITFI